MSGTPPPAPILRQLTAVAIAGRALLIDGPAGVGKSSLALALIDRGAVLIGDDGVTLTTANSTLIASPAPATQGLIEVRGVGLIPVPVCAAAPVALWLRLDPAAPRYIETAASAPLCGIAIPQIVLWPESPVLALRAEMALTVHGLPGIT